MSTLPNLTTEEVSSGIKDPILIVDKDGLIGKEIILKVGSQVQFVFATKTKPHLAQEYSKNVLYVPFLKKHPTIPDGKYSAFFIVDNLEGELRDFLGSFVSRALSDKTPMVYGASFENTSNSFAQDILKKYPSLKVLIYGEVVDENLSFPGLTNKILRSSILDQRVVLPQDGLTVVYPVLLEDVAMSFLEIIFGMQAKNSLFYAFPSYAPTALSLARAVQKIEPNVKIDFAAKKENYPTPPSVKAVNLLPKNYSIDSKIKRIITKFESPKVSIVLSEKKKNKSHSPFPFKSLFVAFALFIFLPVIVTFSFLTAGLFSLWQSQSSFSNGDIQRVSFFSKSAVESFAVARATFELLNLEASAVGMSSKMSVLGQNIDAGKDLSKALFYGVDSYVKLEKVFSGRTSANSKDFSDANVELSNALVLIEKTKANKDVFGAIKNEIRKNSGLLGLASSVQSVLPELVGIDGRRNYLVLFQNNMEIRPNGGFIGSYGILSLDKGKLSEFVVSDVYDADGQLKGHVEPPFPVRRYLPSEHWYLRDSNFDLDFSKSASFSAFFINVEKNQNVDGVIAVNLSFVQNLLKLIGSVDLPEYNQTVTSDNFFKLAQEHSENNFFPGSTQKKDFLGSVFRAVQNKITNKKISYVALAKAVGEGLKEKNILITSSNPYVQGLFVLNNWSASLYDNRGVGSSKINDYLQINEANLGVNKVNYFIERKVFENVSIGESGQIASELSINYKNKSDGSWPGGDYKNYLRIALPLGAKISSIKINGEQQQIKNAITDPRVYEAKSFTSPSGLEIENYQENGKEIYGMLINVPQKSSLSLVIDYMYATNLDISSLSASYNFRFVKQPGIDSVPFDLNISYPENLSVVNSSNLLKQGQSLIINKDIISDEDFGVLFSSK